MAKSFIFKNDKYLNLKGIVIPTGIDWVGNNQLAVKCQRYNNYDFNDLKDTGIYFGDGVPSGKGCSNYPENITGALIVLRVLVFTYQWYLSYAGNIYYRAHYTDSGWSNWKSL